jgi:hypothetical protein
MRWILPLVVALCCTLAPLDAQGKGKGKGKGKSSSPVKGAVYFVEPDIRAIREYYAPGGSLPPGLAKRGGDLPPGLEKQLRRNGALPPGLQKKLAPFPRELDARLAALPPDCGCRRVALGGWAILIQDASNTILDIIELSRR